MSGRAVPAPLAGAGTQAVRACVLVVPAVPSVRVRAELDEIHGWLLPPPIADQGVRAHLG